MTNYQSSWEPHEANRDWIIVWHKQRVAALRSAWIQCSKIDVCYFSSFVLNSWYCGMFSALESLSFEITLLIHLPLGSQWSCNLIFSEYLYVRMIGKYLYIRMIRKYLYLRMIRKYSIVKIIRRNIFKHYRIIHILCSPTCYL